MTDWEDSLKELITQLREEKKELDKITQLLVNIYSIVKFIQFFSILVIIYFLGMLATSMY